ncbi:MAG: ChaN family lipoprotein, partial [Chitinophagaceae bacterium]|nr:ChaN family lipoprotein [Rubrivivax sp.]
MADRRPSFPMGLAAAGLVLLSACASTAPPALPTRPVLLLGEVHDNAQQHAQRLQLFEALLASGARPALAMEQLDRDRQGAIDALRGRRPPAGASEIVRAGAPDESGWNWDFYRPFIALALQHDLPIVAANVSRAEARQVMQLGLAARGFDAEVPADVLTAHSQSIQASHCGMVDAPTAARMARAQVARDQFMARVLEDNAARGVVLLAGNGHVRTDVGAPRWLSAATRARSQADRKSDSSYPLPVLP